MPQQEIPRELLERVATGKVKAAPKTKAPNRPFPEGGESSTPLPASTATLDAVQLLLQLLNKTRWDHRKDWRDIATSLKNGGNQSVPEAPLGIRG